MNKKLQAAMQRSNLDDKLPCLPNFIQKLWVILNSQGFENLIRWDESGESFHVVDARTFCDEVLPNFFKHANITSFVRQLNLYGFRKVSSVGKNSFGGNSEHLHFTNPYFIRDHYHLLHKIKRNAASAKQKNNQASKGANVPTGKSVTIPEEDLICLLQELKIVRERQTSMKSTITQLTRDNILLWQEMAALRNSYLKQKENIGKLVSFLMELGQSHAQKRMPHNQRIQLEDMDGPVQHYSSSSSQSNNCLAIQQSRLTASDCDILDGIQQDLSDSILPNPVSLNVETALLEGLQLRQRAIEEGAPYLDNGILTCDDQYQAVERPLNLRNEERLRYYESTAPEFQLKRPFQRRVLSPVELYAKRALYSGNQKQELVPSASRGRLPIRRSADNQQAVVECGNLQLANFGKFIQHNGLEEDEEVQYFSTEQPTGMQMMFDEDYQNDEEEETFAWTDDEEFTLMNNDELEDKEDTPTVEHRVPVKKN